MFGMKKIKNGVDTRVRKKFEDMFTRLDRIHERERQADRHRMTVYVALMHSIT